MIHMGQCPLCGAVAAGLFHVSGEPRRYFRCDTCALVYLHPAQRPSPEEERARYEMHRNHADPGYVEFLRRLADPLIQRLPRGARGLDFGCGPGPVLSVILSSEGLPCLAYDPLFAPNAALLGARYDFITCSEVIEHVHDPAEVFALLSRLLGPGGVLGVMTRFYPDTTFGDWWYRRDSTHVCFYAEATMRWVAARHGWGVTFPSAGVSLFAAT